MGSSARSSAMSATFKQCTSGLEKKPPFPVDQPAVAVDLPTLPQVAEHVPVDAGLVGTARLGVPGAHGQVDGSADLLVEEHLPGEAPDLEIGADADLAQEASAFVRIQQRVEQVLAPGRL